MNWRLVLHGDIGRLMQILRQPSGYKEEQVRETFERDKAFMRDCCDCIIPVSCSSFHLLHELYDVPLSKVVYVPHGVSDDCHERSREERISLRAKYGYGEEERIILFAGRLDPDKGIVDLIESFRQLRLSIPAACLAIIGSGDLALCMKHAHPAHRFITFTSFLPKEQLYEWYAIADVGVVPSRYEEFGYVAAEMMLHRLPVVVCDTTGLSEITAGGKYGVAFRAGQSGDVSVPLHDALLRALSSPLSMEALEEIRKRVLEHYSFASFRQRMKKVYDTVRNNV